MKIHFYTLGCKVNQYESRAMAGALDKYGFETVGCDEDADVYVINSCTVTAESDRKTRQAVRRFRKNHPESIIVVTGCMTQAIPETEALIPEADIVIGNHNNQKLAGLIMKFISEHKRIVDIEPHLPKDKFVGDTITDYPDRTRATVKIQDGCNRFCSYCLIPYARGRIRSKPFDILKEELAALEKKGFHEVVLVGINLSSYGMDLEGENLTIVDAVKLAASFEGIKRVRLGSLEPDHITDEVIKGLAETPKFCPQFHISLQSGCDATLRRMNRHYDSVEYEDLCNKLRHSFKDCTLTTDLMVGFPGETAEDFEISLNFMKKIKFEKVHVFPYSRRPGTPAAKMDNQIENAEKQRRAEIMIYEAEKIRKAFLEKQIGSVLEIIPEEYHGGCVQGYTANYIPVKIENFNENAVFDSLIKAEITGVSEDFCVGIIPNNR